MAAKLEAVITADITPFDKELKKAVEGAKDFGKSLGDIGSNFIKSFSGFDISAALGIAGGIIGLTALTEGVEKFASAAVNAAKQGYDAFEKFEKSILQLKYALPSSVPEAARGREAREIGAMAGGKGGLFSGEEMRTAARLMMQASTKFAESPEKLNHLLDALKDVAFAQGSNITQVAESFKNLLVGAKEGKEGGARAISAFFTENAALVPKAEEFRAQYEKAAPEKISETMKTMDIGQFMSTVSAQIGLPAMIAKIEEMLSKAAPGAAKEAEAEEPGIKLAKGFASIQTAFGEKLKPAIDELIQTLIGFLPTIRDSFMGVAEAMKVVIPIMSILVGVVQGITIIFNTAIAAVAAFIDRISFGAFSGLRDALAAQEEANKTADTVNAKLGSLGAAADKTGEKVGELGDKLGEASHKLVEVNGYLLNAADAAKAGVNPEALKAEFAAAHPEAAGATEAQRALTAVQKEAANIMLEAAKENIKAAEIQIEAGAAHAEAARRIDFSAAQFSLRERASAEAKRIVIDRPRGMNEVLDKQYAAQAEADAKSINIRAEKMEKINAANEESENQIAKIETETAVRNSNRKIEDAETALKIEETAKRPELTGEERGKLEMALQNEIDARQAIRNAQDEASSQSIIDTQDAAREKIREADIDAANKIIDAQEEAAVKIIDAQEAAALSIIDKMKGPFEAMTEEEPAEWGEFGHWGTKGKSTLGEYHESASERKRREKENREKEKAAEEANNEWKMREKMLIKREFEAKKQRVEDALEAQRPTLIGLKRIHEIQQEEHVKAIEAEKARTEADQAFAAQHKELKLPGEPKKEPTGKADVSRKVVAEILAKIFDQQTEQKKEFEKVFLTD